MNALLDQKILGWLLIGIGVAEWVPLVMAFSLGERLYPLAAGSLTCLVVGLSIAISAKPTHSTMRNRDAFLVVAAGWLLASLFGSLPYLLSGVLQPVDAVFEAVAGFTTTGSTVLNEIEQIPRSILLWRSLTQWLGGMGIIVFALAILPLLGVGGMQLFKAEMPGLSADKLQPRISATARRLVYVYIGFTIVEMLALKLAGLSFFDAVCHALTTISTGGFSTRNASIGAFESSTVEWIVIVFMMLGGINFALHYRLLCGELRTVSRDTELRYFLGMIVVASLTLAWQLNRGGQESGHELRTALFQVVSIVTTTGYGTADFEAWPALAPVVLLALMVLGGMAGSTSGGVKDVRVLLSFKVLHNALARSLHPHAVGTIRYGGKTVPADILAGVWSFLTAYVTITLIATGVMALAGYDLVSAGSAAITSIGNVGPGLGALGPTETFSDVPAYAKLTLAFCMIAGRLEIFTLLVLFVPRFWRR